MLDKRRRWRDYIRLIKPHTPSFAYARDANGNIIKVTYPDGTIITKTYDDDSRKARGSRWSRSPTPCDSYIQEPKPKHRIDNGDQSGRGPPAYG